MAAHDRRSRPSGETPLWAAAAGIAIGGERLGVLGVVGAVLVLAGTGWGRRAASAP